MVLFRRGNKKNSIHLTPLIWRLQAPDQASTVGGLFSVSPPEEHNERRKFWSRGGNPRNVTAALRSISKEAFSDSFQKLYERY
jgi:hypothetical protein